MDPNAAPENRCTHASGRHRHSLRRGERGATLVEYALIVAIFAVGSIAAIDLLSQGAAVSTQNTADDISSGPRG